MEALEIRIEKAQEKTAGAVMFLLTTDILDTMDSGQDAMALSKMIQKECCFNKRMSDILADIALLLQCGHCFEAYSQACH